MKAENLFHYYTSVHNNERQKPAVYTEFHYLQYITLDNRAFYKQLNVGLKPLQG